MRSIARAAICRALRPSSGSVPACAARPWKVTWKLSAVGPAMMMPPTGPSTSGTKAMRERTPVTSNALEPTWPTSSPTVNSTSAGGCGTPEAAIASTASTIAATAALSSAPSTLDPSVCTAPSRITGSMPGVGRTVSVCAHRSTGSSSARVLDPGQKPRTLRCGSTLRRTPASSSFGRRASITGSSFGW